MNGSTLVFVKQYNFYGRNALFHGPLVCFSNPSYCLQLLVHCFHGVSVSPSKLTDARAQVLWLLQLMGHIKNLTLGTVPVEGLTVWEVRDMMWMEQTINR